jgi:hypothetical protein
LISGSWLASSKALTIRVGTIEAASAVEEKPPVRAWFAPTTIRMPKPTPGAIRHSQGRRVSQPV